MHVLENALISYNEMIVANCDMRSPTAIINHLKSITQPIIPLRIKSISITQAIKLNNYFILTTLHLSGIHDLNNIATSNELVSLEKRILLVKGL